MSVFRRLWNVAFPPPPARTIAPLEARPQGFFTTDLPAPHVERDEWPAYFRGLDERIFQRSHANLRGTSSEAIAAMDSAEAGMFNLPSLKEVYSVGNYGVPDVLATWYAAQGFIGYQMCAVLLQHWFIDKACTMPARDAMRNGFAITVNSEVVKPEVLAEMAKLDKQFNVIGNATEFVRMCRAYGIRIVLFKVDGIDYEAPFNIDGVKPGSYRGMSQVDPYWITPELDFRASADPSSVHFYEPTFWRINGVRYHRSHLVVIRTCEVPDVLKPTYFFGGIPLPQRIYERVYAAERTANEAPMLAMSKRTTIVKLDLAQAAAQPAKLTQALQKFANLWNNFGTKVIGLGEEAQQFDTALGDVDTVIMTQYQLCCSIAEVPATKMLGTMPKGFNATGEYEESSYHEMLEGIQQHDAQPLIERHHLLIKKAYVCPKFDIPMFETTIAWNDLDAETAKEKADRTLAESTRDKNWSDAGAIDGIDIRNRIRADKDSGYNGIEEAAPEVPPPPDAAPVGEENEEAPAPAPAGG